MFQVPKSKQNINLLQVYKLKIKGTTDTKVFSAKFSYDDTYIAAGIKI